MSSAPARRPSCRSPRIARKLLLETGHPPGDKSFDLEQFLARLERLLAGGGANLRTVDRDLGQRRQPLADQRRHALHQQPIEDLHAVDPESWRARDRSAARLPRASDRRTENHSPSERANFFTRSFAGMTRWPTAACPHGAALAFPAARLDLACRRSWQLVEEEQTQRGGRVMHPARLTGPGRAIVVGRKRKR